MHDTVLAGVLENQPVEALTDSTRAMLSQIEVAPWEYLDITMTKDGWFDCGAVIDKDEYLKRLSRPDGKVPLDALLPALSTNASVRWADRVPEKERLTYSRWKCAPTDTTVITISSVWPKGHLRFGSEEARTRFYYLYLRFQQQLDGSLVRAAFKLEGTVPAPSPGFIDNSKYPLSAYQLVASQTALSQECYALFLDRGLGKTAIAINRIMNEARRAAANKRRNGRPLTVLIVAPKNVRHNWKAELSKFACLPGQVTVLAGGQLDRVKQLIEAINVLDDEVQWTAVIASYDAIPRSWAAVKMIKWDLAILDESHYIKATTSKRQKAFLALRERCEQKMVLTGSPIGNTILDLWGQLEFLGEGLSGFSSWKAFQRFYTQFEERKNNSDAKSQGIKKVSGFKNMPLLQERLARLAFIGTKKEFMPYLPEKTYSLVGVSMTTQQRNIYMKLATELAVQMEAELAKAERGERAMTINNILVKLLRLSQVTSGFVTWDEVVDPETGETLQPKKIDPIEPNPKIEALSKLLKEGEEGYKTIVWAVWKPDIQRIMQMCKDDGIDAVCFHGSMNDEERANAEHRFNNDPKCTVFVGNPTAGGVGLNLRGYDLDVPGEVYADRTVYYSQNWSSLVRGQSEDRNHGRDRCRGPVEYIDLVIPGTIDEEIRERVLAKQVTASQIQDVRDIMKKILDLTKTIEEGDDDE